MTGLGGAPGWDEIIGVLLMHSFVFLIMFYWACNVACSETDSREHVLKFLLMALYGLSVAFMQFIPWTEPYNFLVFVLWYFFLGFGLLFWVNREDVPLMARNRQKKASALVQPVFAFFEPGRLGAAKSLLVMALIGSGLPALAWIMGVGPGNRFGRYTAFGGSGSSGPDELTMSIAIALPILGLFLLALADAILSWIESQRRNYALRRSTTLLAWGFIATISSILVTLFLNPASGFDSHPLIITLGLCVTPFLTPWAIFNLFDSSAPAAWTLCAIFGGSGVVMILLDGRRVARNREVLRFAIGPDFLRSVREADAQPSVVEKRASGAVAVDGGEPQTTDDGDDEDNDDAPSDKEPSPSPA
jgi:hypothetical protein